MSQGWRRGLFLAFFPLSLCGLFLMIASRHLRPGAGTSRGTALAVGLALSAPMAVLMLTSFPWRAPDLEDEDDEEPEPD